MTKRLQKIAPDTLSLWRYLGATLVILRLCEGEGEPPPWKLISEDDAHRGRGEDDARAPYSLRAWEAEHDG